MELSELLERLEKAEEPDFELDCRLFAIVHKLPVPFSQAEAAQAAGEIPLYTSSLDSAVALCGQALPGWHWAIDKDCDGFVHHPTAYDSQTGYGGHCSIGLTPALALCTAVVKAMMEKEE